MKKSIAILFAVAAFAGSVMADNALTNDQLMKSIENSVNDYAANDPAMAKAISGLHTVTVGNTAQVTIDMNSGGMKMSAKYICAPAAADMACNLQP